MTDSVMENAVFMTEQSKMLNKAFKTAAGSRWLFPIDGFEIYSSVYDGQLYIVYEFQVFKMKIKKAFSRPIDSSDGAVDEMIRATMPFFLDYMARAFGEASKAFASTKANI